MSRQNPPSTPTLTLRSCPHESELRTLLARGQWPTAAPADLRTHVAACRRCSDQALLTTAFHAERAAASAEVQLPPPGLLWWRAQLHRRNQALERINRPLIGAQLFALVSIAVTLVAFALFIGRDLLEWTGSLTASNSAHLFSIFTASHPSADHLSSSHLHASATEWLALSSSPAYLLPTIALLVLAGGVALYLTSERS